MQQEILIDLNPQGSFGFPKPLSEKYEPKTIDEIAGLEKQKKIISAFLANPYPSAWLFVGASGVGKTSMGRAMANAIPAEMIHVPSKDCDLERVDKVSFQCAFMPLSGKKMWLVLVDECDQMTQAAQIAWLSKLDNTAPIPNAVVVFTCNDVERLEKRFLSRCRTLEFTSYGMAQSAIALLKRVWDGEVKQRGLENVAEPNFARIIKESNNNVRDALMKLEIALLEL